MIVKIAHPQSVSLAIKYLKAGKLVVYPTDTAYGLAVDPDNSLAIKQLLQFKGHRQQKPFSLAVSSLAMAQERVKLNSLAKQLYHHFLPGPLTVVSQNLKSNSTTAIRFPHHPWALELIKQFNRPITATSANPSGSRAPYSIKQALSYLKNAKYQILVIDAGRLPLIPPSTIIDATSIQPQVLRYGSLISPSSLATQFLGQILSQQKIDILLLQGELGTGKTTLVKGLAQGLGIKDLIRSPSYTLVKEYPGLVHVDLYRLKSIENIYSYIQKAKYQILAVEWPHLLKNPQSLFPHQKILSIQFKIISDTYRQLELKLML